MEKYCFNECFVCFSTRELRKCSKCKTVSYCGTEHQKKHWKDHKHFCKSMSEILKSQNKSHIYENLDSAVWFEERDKIIQQVETTLKRSLNDREIFLVNFPVCFVCGEIDQEKLKTCPRCGTVNFCDVHPKSHIHDRNCFSGEKRAMDDVLVDGSFTLRREYELLFFSAAADSRILARQHIRPTCAAEFFALFVKQDTKLDCLMMTLLSQVFHIPLTLFNVLQTLFNSTPSEVVIHLKSVGYDFKNDFLCCWEILFHLLGEINHLKIVYPVKLHDHVRGVCRNCNLSGKYLLVEEKLLFKEQLNSREKPTLIAICISSRQDNFYQMLETIDKVNCPVILMTSTESLHQKVEQEFLNASTNFRIIYSGYNDFSSLIYRDTLPGSKAFYCRNAQFITIFQHEENIEHEFAIFESSYYSQVCQVCRKPEARVVCNRCMIISYCSVHHKNRDQIHHKDMCQVICNLTKEMGTDVVLYNSKTCDSDLWLRQRIEMLKNVHFRLERNLKKYEGEMILFPKACRVCHDSDLYHVESCKCGVFFCKLHQNDEQHKQVCSELSIAFETYKSEAIFHVNFSLLRKSLNETCKKENMDLINAFVGMIVSLLDKISDKIFNGQLPISMKKLSCSSTEEIRKEEDTFAKTMFIVNFLSAPLTLFYAIEKMNTKINSSMVIHVIGANREDFEEKFLWAFLFFDVDELEDLKLIFIGSEFPNYPETQVDKSSCSWIKLNLKIEGHALNYNEYFSSEKFIKPDIILGFNLNLHESKLAIPEKIWKKTISTCEKVRVPLVLSSGTKKHAEKDHETICELVEKNVAFQLLEKNPFASLYPERDFETGGVMYSNKFIIAYDWKSRISSTMEEKEDVNKVNCEHSNDKSDDELETSESLLIERNKILSDEIETLKGLLNLAYAKITKQKNQILDLQKIYADFVEKFDKSVSLSTDKNEKSD